MFIKFVSNIEIVRIFIIHLNLICLISTMKGSNYAVLKGGDIRIGCIPKNVQVEGESDVESSYTWLDGENKEVIDARFTKLSSGELEITNAHVSDSGTYTCKFRPPTAWSPKNASVKDFQHKLIVYEIAEHSFHSTVFFDLSTHTAEGTANVLSELLKSRVCGSNLCVAGTIKSKKCVLLETGKESCEFLMVYRGIKPLPDENCDEDCVGEIIFDGLKKAEKALKSTLMGELENPKALLKPDMKSFETKHFTTCKSGFRLVKTHHKRCFPCFPGSYSHRNSLKCTKCAVGFYQESHGKHECQKCEEGKTTESVGASHKEECITTTSNILSNIKEGIASIFTG